MPLSFLVLHPDTVERTYVHAELTSGAKFVDHLGLRAVIGFFEVVELPVLVLDGVERTGITTCTTVNTEFRVDVVDFPGGATDRFGGTHSEAVKTSRTVFGHDVKLGPDLVILVLFLPSSDFEDMVPVLVVDEIDRFRQFENLLDAIRKG